MLILHFESIRLEDFSRKNIQNEYQMEDFFKISTSRGNFHDFTIWPRNELETMADFNNVYGILVYCHSIINQSN